MGDRLTILFTNIWLDTYAGSEVVVRDLAIGTMRRGHRPIVYTPTAGNVAEELKRKGVAVIDDLRMLAETPDIIHAHHAIPCAEALIRFPGVPAINVCHAFEHWLEAPVHFPQIGAYVAVDEACRDRLVHTQSVDPARVVVLPNAVDLERVPPRPQPLPDRPRRALAFGKTSAVAQIRSACKSLSIDFDAIGFQVGRMIANPEEELVQFDLVFACARAALEALCCGCAVVVCDPRGIAGLVTSENFSMFRERNFGLRSLAAPVTVERLIENIQRYDRVDADAVCVRARRDADLEKLLDDFEKLYAEVISGARRPFFAQGAHETAVAQFLHDYLPRHPGDPRWPWLCEREALRERTLQLENQLADTMQEQGALGERSLQLENRLADMAQELELCRAGANAARTHSDATQLRLADSRTRLASALQELAMVKRSRLLKFGRWLRRIRGLPVAY
jgi:glycosyltransferase involved in cell wall biosynthesis